MQDAVDNVATPDVRGKPDRSRQFHLLASLITPARNEEAFIERTIDSVIQQTVLPAKWVIVDDGSTDRTADIVSRYLPEHSWMELVRRPQRQGSPLRRQGSVCFHCRL